MEDRTETLERALSRSEGDIDAATKAATATTAQLKAAKKAAAAGSLRDLERSLASAEQLVGALRESVQAARAGWSFDDRAYLESGDFTRELVELGAQQELGLQEQDDRLVCYPSTIRVLPGEAAVEVDRKRSRAIRPSALVDRLKAAQARPVRFNAERFIEALHQAYGLVRALREKDPGATLRLVDIYRALTILPGQASAYALQEFARDIYLLDESGVDRTKSGARMSLPASSGARTSSTLVTVMRSGELKIYYGIDFQ
ncbi:MAG: hypothetical protein ABI317_09485 [Gaiellales bacterium]